MISLKPKPSLEEVARDVDDLDENPRVLEVNVKATATAARAATQRRAPATRGTLDRARARAGPSNAVVSTDAYI
jgi:outer membrane murein-binding lipoprotein Lpp